MEDSAAAYRERLAGLTAAEEIDLLNTILTRGYDQGCVLHPVDPGHIVPGKPEIAEAILGALAARDIHAEATEPDPYERDRVPTSPITGDEPRYVILTQACDLIRGLAAEPFVELAHVSLETDTNLINSARRNSPRLILLSDGPDGSAWIVDLRRRALLAKDQLPTYEVVQAIDGEHPYKRFKMRVGNRYSRDALPTDLVERLQRPMRSFLLKKPALMKKLGVFTDLIVFRRENDQVQIMAVIDAGKDQREAEDAWEEIEDALPEDLRAIIHEDSSGAFRTEDVNWWRYTTGWKMDLDEVTYSRKAGDQALPTL